jgi:AraC-like DNA-binding protein
MAVPLRAWAEHRGVPSVYREFAPAPEIAGVVAATWYGRPGRSRTLRVLPDGCTDLVWNGRELVVVVTAAAPLRVWLPPEEWAAGLRLRCGVAGSLLGHGLADLPPKPVPLREFWREAAWAEDALASCRTFSSGRVLLESLVVPRLRPGFEAPWLAAVRALADPSASVADVGARLGISARGLRRRLCHEVGVGPKQVQRVLRFRRFLSRLAALDRGATSLAVVAADLGYADQSHLGRECRRLSGSTPAELVANWRRGRKVPDGAVSRRAQSAS